MFFNIHIHVHVAALAAPVEPLLHVYGAATCICRRNFFFRAVPYINITQIICQPLHVIMEPLSLTQKEKSGYRDVGLPFHCEASL